MIACVTPLTLMFNSNIFYFSFMAYENGIHPDPTTGRPILSVTEDVALAYPPYYNPSLAVLVFSVALQIIVELSVTVQWALSLKFITALHP